MKILKFFCILILVLLCFSLFGCATEQDENIPEEIRDLYGKTVVRRGRYEFTFQDLEHKIIFKKQYGGHQFIQVHRLSETVYEVFSPERRGMSTNWAAYVDPVNSRASSTFYDLIDTKDEYVIHVDEAKEGYYIVVEEMFANYDDPDRYYKEYPLENVSPFVDDVVIEFKIDENGNAVATYRSGIFYTKTDVTFTVP